LRRIAALLALGVCAASGCTTVTAPVLRHETGEALGGLGHFRAYAHIERGRLVPMIPQDSNFTGVEQETGVFTGALFGVQGAAGITPKLDLQAGTYLSQGGGGWRLGAKYQWLGTSNGQGWAIAAMAGYGRASGEGTLIYTAPASIETEVQQTLAARTLDLSLPVSYRFSPTFAAYTGLTYISNSVNGLSGGTFVEASTNDFAWNLGLKVSVNFMRFDLEMALLQANDPFLDENRIIPVYGLSAGVQF
jgi:hypothetical protein